MVKLSLKSQKGDTIVEVLIAIVIVMVVLAAGYVSASKSTSSTVRSREHDEGVKIAQTQVEQLRALLPINTSIKNATSLFCFYVSGSATQYQAFSGTEYTAAGLPQGNNVNNSDENKYPANCRLNNSGEVFSTGGGAKYLVSINRAPPTPASTQSLNKLDCQAAGGSWAGNPLTPIVAAPCTIPGSTDADLYRVDVRWLKAGGGFDRVTFSYRVYP